MAYAKVAAKTANKTIHFARYHRNNAEDPIISIGNQNHVPTESAFTRVTPPLGLASLEDDSIAPNKSAIEGDAKKTLNDHLVRKQRDPKITNVTTNQIPPKYTLPLKAKDKLAAMVKSRMAKAKQSTEASE